MKRTIGAVVTVLLAGALFAAPAQSASVASVTVKFHVAGVDLAALNAKSAKVLDELDSGATWSLSYTVVPRQVAIGGGKFETRWSADVEATQT
jgi:hypothetical protein